MKACLLALQQKLWVRAYDGQGKNRWQDAVNPAQDGKHAQKCSRRGERREKSKSDRRASSKMRPKPRHDKIKRWRGVNRIGGSGQHVAKGPRDRIPAQELGRHAEQFASQCAATNANCRSQ